MNMIQDLINDSSSELIFMEGEGSSVPDFLSRYNAVLANECTFNSTVSEIITNSKSKECGR